MRTQLKINGELKDVEIENGEITIIEPEGKKTGWEFSTRPYYITAAGVTGGKGLNCDGMNKIYQTANAFSSEELVENINRMQTLQRQIFRWQAENDVPIRVHTDKYIICYIICADGSVINCEKTYGTEYPFLPCFSSKEKAEECRELFIEDLQWLFTEFRWRMDG